MQPIKIVFQSIFTANDLDFTRYKGISKINKVIEREWDDLKKGSYFSNAFKNIVNMHNAEIEALFMEDFSSASFKAESATFELTNVGHGPTPATEGGHAYNYSVEVALSSVVYNCLAIFENGTYVCFEDSERELKFIRQSGKVIVLE